MAGTGFDDDEDEDVDLTTLGDTVADVMVKKRWMNRFGNLFCFPLLQTKIEG